MKKILFTLLIFVFAQNVFGQGINFQGVARSANGTILANQKISLKLSIITGSNTSTPDYIEIRSVATNAQGIFSIVVGDTGAINTIGTFLNINWKTNLKFLKVEMDPNNGINFISMGTTPLQYVPFSYYSNGVDAANVSGVLPVKSGGTGFTSFSDLKAAINKSESSTFLNRINFTDENANDHIAKYDTGYNSPLIYSRYFYGHYGDLILQGMSKTYTGNIHFVTGSNIAGYDPPTQRMVIMDNGNVGIGDFVSSAPTSKLQVSGMVSATGYKVTGGLSTQYLRADGTVTTFSDLKAAINKSESSTFLNRINFTDENANDHINKYDTGYNSPLIYSRYFYGHYGDLVIQGMSKTYTGNIHFVTGSNIAGYDPPTQRMVIMDNGNIGIGDFTPFNPPTSKLQVNGNITAKKFTSVIANTYNFSTGTNNVDLSSSNIYTINLSGNNILTFSNGTPGTYIIKLIQDGIGSRTVTFPVLNWKWAGGSIPTLSTTANSTDIVSLIYDGTTYYAKIDKGFAIGSYINQNVSTTVTLSGKITKDTTLFAKDVNYLSGIVYITKGVTLTIQEGAKVQGKSGANVAALVICRGAKIIAKGTAEKPVIFTSASANPLSGDWGGIVILGTAKVNQSYTWKGATVAGLTSVEGGVNDTEVGYGLAGSGDAAFPTGNDADNSGILQYVRIDYAGYAYQPDNELNSLTMAGVGNGTTIDHIQVTYAKDDAFEWLGGTVNCKYLIAYKTQDDDFDTDFGYTGNVQFGIALRDSVIADISNSHAFESDNDGRGSDYAPKTTAVFSNITAIGPRINPTSGKGNNLFYAGAQIRRNSGISIQNSIIAGWPRGITIDESTVTTNGATYKNLEDSIIRLKNVTLAGNTIDVVYVGKSGASTNKTDADVLGIFSTPYYGNTILNSASADVLKLTQPFNYTNPDFTPFGSSSTGSDNIASSLGTLGIGVHLDYNKNGDFTDSKLQDAFFEKVTFRGAVATSGANQSWWKGWTVWR